MFGSFLLGDPVKVEVMLLCGNSLHRIVGWDVSFISVSSTDTLPIVDAAESRV